LIMSGTPMPNRPSDLITQFKFLFPEQGGITDKNIADFIRPVYVRTTKEELNIPRATHIITKIPFTEPQRRLYDLIRSEEFRRVTGVARSDKEFLRKLGVSYMRLLQVASNPALLLHKKMGFSQELRETIEFGESAKIEYAVLKARKLAKAGKKLLIWSGFIDNVELLSRKLIDLGAMYIHGGVEAGSDEEEDTREGIVKKFHEDPAAFVLVANPAACSEGISLHTVCHHAIYLDRDYNAAKFLQSQDRIHRLGLLPDQDTTIEVLMAPDSIDERVHRRLVGKIQRMAEILNDHSLQREAEVVDLEEDGFTSQDADDLIEHLKE
jgi:SNF2 family DNA or RNA helicase